MNNPKRDYSGPAILNGGFRPFFLAGAIYSALIMVLWLPVVSGTLNLPSVMPGIDWHIHEILFGYLAAILTGFLFTAIPNWTGRLPVRGMPLMGLVLVWLAGRLAITFSTVIGWLPTLLIDCSFLALIVAVAGNEICKGRNWRNLKVLIPVGVLLAANVGYHFEVHNWGSSDYARRAGFLAAVTLIMLIGGRIIPSFTRNWLNHNNPGRLPAPFGKADGVAILLGVIALALWTVWPDAAVSGWALGLAALAHIVRLARWVGFRCRGEILILMLHIAYAFVPLGFCLLAWSILLPASASQAAGLHAFGAGAIGTMTLVVMVRATLGHTGRKLTANTGMKAMFAFAGTAALLRIATGLDLIEQDTGLAASAIAWVLAFAGFVFLLGPALVKQRRQATEA